MFRDRKDAGLRLAAALSRYRECGPLVLAIPRGGVEVGCQVALGLDAPLAILVARKLPLPDNPEAGFGAVAEDGSTFLVEPLAARLSEELAQQIVREQKREIERRIGILRKSEPLPPLRDQTVILVDDGIAMGSTMRAAITMCRNQQARRIIVASPVASPGTADDLAKIADEVIVLEAPPDFTAVAQVYEDWYDVSDEEVIRVLDEYRRISGSGHRPADTVMSDK